MSTVPQGISSRTGWSLHLMVRFALLSVGVWLYAADTLVTATTSPGMVLEIGGVQYLNWGLSLYEVGAIIAGAAAGMLCARFGVKRILCIAALVYAVGCAVAAIALHMRWHRHHKRRSSELATRWGQPQLVLRRMYPDLARELALPPPRRQHFGCSLASFRYYA